MNKNRVSSKMEDKYQIISLNGRMTYDEISHFKEEIKETIIPANGYIITLEGLEAIDSTGIGLLVNTARYFVSNKNKVVLINTDEFIQELLVVSKLDVVFDICESISESKNILGLPDEEYWARVSQY